MGLSKQGMLTMQIDQDFASVVGGLCVFGVAPFGAWPEAPLLTGERSAWSLAEVLALDGLSLSMLHSAHQLSRSSDAARRQQRCSTSLPWTAGHLSPKLHVEAYMDSCRQQTCLCLFRASGLRCWLQMSITSHPW